MLNKTYRLGLNISDIHKRTPEEDARDIKAYPRHTIEGLPSAMDWRVGGYVTPIQDQGDCGSCVAFGTTAAIEISKRVVDHNPTEDTKLSESDLFSHGGTCQNGWTLEAANATAQQNGICKEICWPYGGSKQPCADADPRLKTLGVTRLSSDAIAKQWIATNGPIQAAMDVYTDFFDVDSDAVYHQSYGDLAGGHCVCLVGYDDVDQCWILKNSWSTAWGASGFCRIGYGECGLLRDYVAYGEQIGSSPVPPIPPIPPVPTGDIIVPKDGKMYAHLTYVSNAAKALDLLVNGNSFGILDLMKKYIATFLGDNKQGDALLFDLRPESAHNVIIHTLPFGFGWFVQIGVNKDVMLLVQER